MFTFTHQPDELEKRAVRIFEARLAERGIRCALGYEFKVVRNPSCSVDEFRISGLPGAKEVVVDCGGSVGFLYAVGKLLRTGVYDGSSFRPGDWRGMCSPAKPVRCVYWANHFFNYYHVTDLNELEHYLEDLALLGFNALALACDFHIMKENSAEFFQHLDNNKRLWKIAERLGMQAVDLVDNNSFADAPAHLVRAVPTQRSFFGTELCPSDNESLEYIVRIMTAKYDYLKDANLGMVVFWPYDQGGCGCQKCAPYGANGMMIWGSRIAQIIKERWPKCRMIWSTWLFDWRDAPMVHEFESLYRKINGGEADFIDYILADSHDSFPRYPLEHPLPGKTRLITFPEISMFGRTPWGGFGATPLPKRFAALWGETAGLADGGMLYSEGIFEDFNKALYAGFFTSGSNDVTTTVKEYFHYEMGMPASAHDSLCHFLELLEENHDGLEWWPCMRRDGLFEPMKSKIAWRKKGKRWKDLEKEMALARQLDSMLPDWGRKSWRWRLLYLRAVIDYELGTNDDETTAAAEDALKELCRIYHTDLRNSIFYVAPYTDDYLKLHENDY